MALTQPGRSAWLRSDSVSVDAPPAREASHDYELPSR